MCRNFSCFGKSKAIFPPRLPLPGRHAEIHLSLPSPPLCFIYSPWFTWDWWCSRLIVVIIPVLLLQCIMHNRPTKSTGRGARPDCHSSASWCMLGRSLLRSSSRTADDGDSWCVKTRPGRGASYGCWLLARCWCGWNPLLWVQNKAPTRNLKESQRDSVWWTSTCNQVSVWVGARL